MAPELLIPLIPTLQSLFLYFYPVSEQQIIYLAVKTSDKIVILAKCKW